MRWQFWKWKAFTSRNRKPKAKDRLEGYPADLRRFLDAFGRHAKRLVAADPGERNADTMRRMAEQIFLPWEHNQVRAIETKETTFLRDYFNSLWEVVLACELLDTVRELVRSSLAEVQARDRARAIKYWSEAYLNEAYIFQLRLLGFLTITERKYRKDPDFAEPIAKLCKRLSEAIQDALQPFIGARGRHVHELRRRHTDPELVRLSHLELLVDGLGLEEFAAERDRALAQAEEWLVKQTDYLGKVVWALLDGVCHALAEGIITDNGWIIVPTNHKDEPVAME